MKKLKHNLLFAMVVVLTFSCERLCGCSPPEPLSPLTGDWQLTRITYGLTQKTVTATEAGYSETFSFNGHSSGGTYRQTRNGLPVNSGSYSLLFPNGGSTEGLVLYQNEMEQSFQLQANTKLLILTERKPRTVAIADGSTYEYQRY